ncbi:MAG: DUF3619 family protein [Pseudomonadota bacterium]|nr:DUF3619 family protein [Pseudomonadota bacterium]
MLADRDAAQASLARRIVARLNEDTDRLGADIAERLRFARERALERARLAHSPAAAAPKVGITAAGAAILGGGSSWWFRLASAAPLLALVCGLVLIQQWQTKAQISVAAEVDAALLADDVPPNAYSDAGFVEFLKTPPRE